MSDISVRSAKLSKALNALSWIVLLVGGLLGALALACGFDAVEPWTTSNGVVIDEDWMSIGIGVMMAAVIAVVTGTVWGLLKLGSLFAEELAEDYGADEDSSV